jgi:predicted RNase H-like HicB family nuclease
MKTTALIEIGEDGYFGIFTPDINTTIVGEGKTVAEAKADFEISVQEMIASYTENGEPLPKDLQNISFEYKYDIASFFNYFPLLNMSQLAKYTGINPSLMRQYKKGQYISEKQIAKIQAGINKIGRELAKIQLI